MSPELQLILMSHQYWLAVAQGQTARGQFLNEAIYQDALSRMGHLQVDFQEQLDWEKTCRKKADEIRHEPVFPPRQQLEKERASKGPDS